LCSEPPALRTARLLPHGPNFRTRVFARLTSASLLWLVFAGLVLLSVGAAASVGNVTKAGGAAALAFAILAWYHAAGDIIESTFGRQLLPFGPPPLR